MTSQVTAVIPGSSGQDRACLAHCLLAKGHLVHGFVGASFDEPSAAAINRGPTLRIES